MTLTVSCPLVSFFVFLSGICTSPLDAQGWSSRPPPPGTVRPVTFLITRSPLCYGQSRRRLQVVTCQLLSRQAFWTRTGRLALPNHTPASLSSAAFLLPKKVGPFLSCRMYQVYLLVLVFRIRLSLFFQVYTSGMPVGAISSWGR